MLRRTLLVAAAAAAALVGVGCDSNPGPIFPMTIGSVWHTESSTLQGTTTAALDTSETALTTTTVSESASLANGKGVVKLTSETTIHQFSPDSTYTATAVILLNEENGVIMTYGALDDTVGDTLMMSEPEVGQTWSPGLATSVVIGQEDVTVPAGTYKKAWKVKTITNIGFITLEMFSWYARGVGNVRNHYEATYEGQSQVFDEELTSATIK
jgi:hypothetical protein